MLKQQLNEDLKTALLAKDQLAVDTLRGLKSAILYVEVAKGIRDEGLDDSKIIEVLTKESKKRQESADLYKQAGNHNANEKEIKEKILIDKYLPKQLSDDQIKQVIDNVIKTFKDPTAKDMGIIIGQVKKETNGAADGAKIAAIVKERLSS